MGPVISVRSRPDDARPRASVEPLDVTHVTARHGGGMWAVTDTTILPLTWGESRSARRPRPEPEPTRYGGFARSLHVNPEDQHSWAF